MTNTSGFSWFDLNKYEAVESFQIQDWYHQLDKRHFIHLFSKENSETIERISLSRWQYVNGNAKKYIAMIKEEPVFVTEKHKRSILSVSDTDFWDLRMATSGNKSLENVFNSLEGNYLDKNEHQLVISPSDKGSPYERAMLTVNLGATDEQLITDFGEWLKTHRSITNYKIREKRFTSKDFSKWISHKVLPYLDLSLIADAENKLLTQNLLGRMLFPDEYNVDLTERIRRSVKPLAEWLLDKKTIQALSFQVRATKKSL